MKVNKDVKTALTLRGLWAIARPVLWYFFFIFVIFKYVVFGEYDIRVTHIPVYIAFAFIMFVPFVQGWISKAFLSAPFSGKVEKIERKRELVTDRTYGKRGLRDPYNIIILTFFVRDKRGKLHKFPIFEPRFADIDYIKVGDGVRHIFGSSQLEKTDKSQDADVLCVVCGIMSRMDNEICYNCRHTLLKR